MVLYDWANGGFVGAFFRHGMVSGLWGQLVLFQGMGTEFEEKLVFGGCREGYCEYGSATGILCWVYDILGESHPIHLSGLIGSKSDSRTGNP